MYVSLLFVDIYLLSLMIMLDFYIAPESVASHGHPLSIPRGNAGRIEPGTNLAGYQLPITPTSKSHHTGADSTDSVASSFSSGGSSIPPPSPGDVLFTETKSTSRDGLKLLASPPPTPPCTMPLKTTMISAEMLYSGENRSNSIQQMNPNDRESLVMHPLGNEQQKDTLVKGSIYARGSESMQNIHSNEVSISYSPSGDFYNGSSSSSVSQKSSCQIEKLNNYSWVEGATVMTQSVCRSTSSYMSNYTSVTTSSKAAISSDVVDGNRTSYNEKLPNPTICQSPVPYVNKNKQEKTMYQAPQQPQEDNNYHSSTTTNIGPSPAASPKSPLNIQELNPADSVATDSRIAPMLQVPKSPRTPSMGHVIRHRFIKKTFLKPPKCDFCSFTLFRGLKCKECKFKCHTDCEQNVPPSCGLPEEMVKYYFNHLSKENSPILNRPLPDTERVAGYPKGGVQGSGVNPLHQNKPWPDSSSNTSSCNSSTPSSPNVILDSTPNPTPPHSAAMYPRGSVQFTFPNPGQNLIDQSLHSQVSQSGYGGMPFSQEMSHLGVTPGQSNLHQKGVQSNQYASQQSQQNIASAQTPSQNPRSPNPLIVSIQSNDSDKTLSSK